MPSFDLTRFKATHNSYSGESRGTLRSQLDRQIRFLELDIHDNGYAEVGDFRLGHLKPGSEVATGSGNPDTVLLGDWLRAIADWADGHAGHTPISVVLDAKDDLTDGDGDLADLNQTIAGVFGQRLFTRSEYDQAGVWPDTEKLRGRILCVLSGDGTTRAAYRWTFAATPAIAVNQGGDVVLTYVAASGDVSAWVGRLQAAGAQLTWLRKTTYGFAGAGLFQPAVALNDDGWIVAVRSFQRPGLPGPTLESVVGLLQDGGRIRWHAPRTFAQGVLPTLQMLGDEVREIHTMADGRRRQQVRGTLDRRKHRVLWQSPRVVTASPFARDSVAWRGHALRCAVDGERVLACGVDGRPPEPVRLPQLIFVEEQRGDPAAIIRDARFFAASAKDKLAITRARQRGLVTRAWGFEESDVGAAPAPPVENVPATDTPTVAWYDAYMSGPGVAV
jgi:hypothetical protein